MVYYSMVYSVYRPSYKGTAVLPFDLSMTEGDLPMLRKENRTLTLAFLLILISSTIIRILFSVFPKSAYTYFDELFYLELSQNLFLRGTLNVYGAPVHFTKLLYSVLLSPFYAVQDGVLRTELISGFNALLISSALIPGYLLARRILKKNWQVILSLLFLAVSPNLLFSITFMSENLYYPLLLWGFWAAYCYFASGDRKPLRALILGLLAFLLYFTKEVGGAWIIAAGIVLLADCRAESSRKAALRSFGCFLLGFLVPFLLLRFVLLRDLSYSYAHQVSFANLTNPSQVLYLCYAALLVLLYFIVSLLFFPVAVPVVYRKKLSPVLRSLLALTGVYILVVSIGIAFGVSLSADYPRPALRVHLRYFIGAAFPFLLLSLSLLEENEPFTVRSPLVKATAAFAGIILLALIFPPKYGSVVDHPVLFFTRLIPDTGLWPWLCKGIFILLLLIMLLLWSRRRKQVFACLLLPLLLAAGLFSDVLFTRNLTKEEAVTDTDLLQEARQLDQFLDSEDGSVLLLASSLSDARLRLLNTVLNDDYYFSTYSSVKELVDDTVKMAHVPVDLAEPVLPHPIYDYAAAPSYRTPDISRIVTVGDQRLLDFSQYQDITPQGLTSFHVFRAKDPSRLSLAGSLSYTPGDPILFYGTSPSFRKYLPEGFSAVTEDGYTWTNGTESSPTLFPNIAEPRDLTATWTWRMSIGTQICQIFANDVLLGDVEMYPGENELSFYIPAYAYDGYDSLTIRFLFPNARQPGSADPRILAFAFESLKLDVE